MKSPGASLLRCPSCGSSVELRAGDVSCADGHTFPLQNGVPVFLDQPAEIVSADHVSNSIGAEFEAILREGKELILNIGAGGTAVRYPNCIEFEHKIFRHTDVVGDAHHMPFADAVFDRVFAFNVFEHLRDPKRAAAEIRRVLKPGGAAVIHTAFLQALHEPPNHFYNATEFGVREWFSDFAIERCHVSGNFGPGVMLGFLAESIMDAMRSSGANWKDLALLENTTLGEWSAYWAAQSNPPPGFEALQSLPQEFQRRIAAGFELIARKPEA